MSHFFYVPKYLGRAGVRREWDNVSYFCVFLRHPLWLQMVKSLLMGIDLSFKARIKFRMKSKKLCIFFLLCFYFVVTAPLKNHSMWNLPSLFGVVVNVGGLTTHSCVVCICNSCTTHVDIITVYRLNLSASGLRPWVVSCHLKRITCVMVPTTD